MLLPLMDGGLVSGLVCGLLFGYVLENAGFGSPLKLTAQFALTDWSVLKVMLTAVVVAAAGLVGLQHLGLLNPENVFVPSALLVAAALGGVLVGAGFALGGYCPGTSVVGLSSGRVDALVFLLGLLVGTLGFAGWYGPTVEAVLALGEVQSTDVLSVWLAWPDWALVLVLAAALWGVYALGARFERRRGPVSAQQAVAGAQAERA